jgi:ethanolamine utilization protein EutP
MVIGPVGSGKSTLLAALGLGPKEVRKTESLTYNSSLSIDTPGEMLSIPRLYNALILNSGRADLILMIVDGNKPIWLPSKICLALKAPVVGVINKIDIAPPDMLLRAKQSLANAGVKEIVRVSAATMEGIEELKNLLERARTASLDS